MKQSLHDERPFFVNIPLKKAVCLGFVLAFALGLRVYQLDQENFWVDEVAYVEDASQSPFDIVNYTAAPRTRVHHVTPFPHLLVHFFVSPKPSEGLARLPSAIFGTLETLLLFMFGSRLFSFQVGLLAALLLAVSPLHLWYSQEARWYAQWSFLTTCSYVALLYALKNNRASAWIGYGFTTLFNMYTFVYSALVVAIQTVSILSSRLEKRTDLFWKYLATHVCVTAAALPILWMILRGLEKSSGTPRAAGLGDLPYTFFTYAAGFTAGPTLAELHALPNLLEVIAQNQIVLIFFIVFFPAVILGIRETIRNCTASALVLPWLIGLPILVFVIASVTNLTYQVRYTLPALPAFVLILAQGVLSLQSKSGKTALMCGIVFCSIYSVGNYYWETRYDKEHVRAAIARVNAASKGSSTILSIGQIGRTVRYYGDGLDVVNINHKACKGAGSVDSLQEDSLRASKTVWVIAGRDWKDRTQACLGTLSQFYSIIEHQSFTGTDLWLLGTRQ